jgi:dolichol-phosphate mannosyltransferase
MVDPAAVCVLVPTYNEAETIGDIVTAFRDRGFAEVLVVDGGSTDGTRSIAEDAGARVIVQSGSGKGQAVREGLDYVEAPVVLMLDGDATYRPDQADRMLEPVFSGEAEHVIGNRFADMEAGAMSGLNRFGNGLINRTFAFVHGRDLEDILSGYRAFTLESARTMALTEDGFGIETEMAVECVKQSIPTTVVPITYEARPDDSEANLRPFRDGATILLTLYTMARTNNPLFYFGSVGALSGLVGLLLGAYVAVEWFSAGISHEVIAMVAGVAILFGVQLIMFGVLSDLIVTINHEQTAQFRRLARSMQDEAPVAPPGHVDGDTESVTSDPPAESEPPNPASARSGDGTDGSGDGR